MSGSRSETLDGVRDQAASFMQSVIEQAASQALGLGKVGDQAQKKAKRSFRSASDAVSDSAAPSTRDVALSAASAALEIWQSVKGKAGESLSVAEDQVADKAGELLDYTASKAKDVSGTIASGAQAAAETGKQAAVATAHGGKQAAVATVDTSASLAKTAFWLGAAGSIVYFVFLDNDRQQEVRKVIHSVAGQVRDLAGDLRGQDGEFA